MTWRPLSNWWCKGEQSDTNNHCRMLQFGASVFHMVVRWYKLSEMENKFALHNSVVLAIFVPKITKVSKNLKYEKDNFDCFFMKHGVYWWLDGRAVTYVYSVERRRPVHSWHRHIRRILTQTVTDVTYTYINGQTERTRHRVQCPTIYLSHYTVLRVARPQPRRIHANDAIYITRRCSSVSLRTLIGHRRLSKRTLLFIAVERRLQVHHLSFSKLINAPVPGVSANN